MALTDAVAETDHVLLTWQTDAGPGLSATVYRRTANTDWVALAQISPDGSGVLVYDDRAVTPGAEYDYRLGYLDDGVETFSTPAHITVPTGLAFTLDGAQPNPANRELWIALTLPTATPATLELLDVTGRLVRTQSVAGAGRHLVNFAGGQTLPAGIYLVRATQAGVTRTSRVSVVH
jgi:hypothetical protein